MKMEELIGRYVEYRDKDWAFRTGQVKRIYGGKATIEIRWKGYILRYERIPLNRIYKVKVWKHWEVWNAKDH